MKKLILTIVVLLTASIGLAEKPKMVAYKVTVQNLTKGQPITPVVVASHVPGYQLFKLGEAASEGLQVLAKDGDTSILNEELKNAKKVKSMASGTGITLPGAKAVIEVQANPRTRLSLVAMLARTNDAIVAAKSLRLPKSSGQSVTYGLRVYDAGAEANLESCDHIPAPPCGNAGVDTDSNEGFVHDHPGVFGIADLKVLRDTFGTIAAKVTIQKM